MRAGQPVDGDAVTYLEDIEVVATSRRRPFVVGSVLAALMTVIVLLWIVLGVDGARVTDGVDDIGELLAALIAAGACGVAARKVSVGRTSWALLAGSSFAWAVGEALWSYYDLIKGIQVPFPSLADVGFLTAVPIACVGLLLFPSSHQRTVHRLQGLLDGCIIAMSLLFASWATILGPLYRSHQGGVLKQVISLAYPMSDVVMVSLAPVDELGFGDDGSRRLRLGRQFLFVPDRGEQLRPGQFSRHRLGGWVSVDRPCGSLGHNVFITADRTNRAIDHVTGGPLRTCARGPGGDIDSASAGSSH